MEVVFDKVSYNNILIDLKLSGNKIYSVLGSNYFIGSLIMNSVKPSKGKVLMDTKSIGYVRMNPNDMLFNDKVKSELLSGLKYFNYKLDKKSIRSSEALKLVGLDDTYLDKSINELSIREKKLISIASVLIFNPKVIIFDEPTLFLSYKDIENIKRLFKLLKSKYNRMIIIVSKDTYFSYIISDEVIYNKSNNMILSNKDIFKDIKLLNECNLKVPDITKFINIVNKDLTYTSNILDLIKEVYRSVY